MAPAPLADKPGYWTLEHEPELGGGRVTQPACGGPGVFSCYTLSIASTVVEVLAKRELSRKARPCVCYSVCPPTLTYGHELWLMAGWRIQASEIGFRPRVAGFMLRNRKRSSVVQQELELELNCSTFRAGLGISCRRRPPDSPKTFYFSCLAPLCEVNP